ncbi:MAG: hypothetical protein ACTSRA_22420, partial [Promethearchaeota archaeon]
IKRYLLKNKNVSFASYKKVFYEDATIFITTEGESALDALIDAADLLYIDLQKLKTEFDNALKDFK